MLEEAFVCEHMGWTHQEYIEQPEAFLRALKIKMTVYSRIEKEAHEKARRAL